MKVFLSIVTLVILVSCQGSKNDEILGKWKVSTSAFQAVYQIQKSENGYDCRVMSYNDGTTVYSEESKTRPYIFKNVNPESTSTVDGSTGATKSNGTASNTHNIRVINEHQIEVVSKIMNQKKIELWTRVQ